MSDPSPSRDVINAADWERVLSAAAHVQRIIPDAILVGGSAAALYAAHRYSADDHILVDLRKRFAAVLSDLEATAGWTTNRLVSPIMILGNLEGVDTGIRQLRREAPLETTTVESPAGPIVVPTLEEMLRIKAWLVVSRNATRDYIDCVALADRLGFESAVPALERLDELYPQPSVTVTQQLVKQLAEPRPYDFELDLRLYKGLHEPYTDWSVVRERAMALAVAILDRRGRD